MSLRTLLLERLKQKPDAEFEEILFRLEDLYYSGLRSHISAGAVRNTRAMQLIDFLQQDRDGLDHLVEQLGVPFTVPCAVIVELENLLQRAGIAEATVRSVFDAYLESLEDQAAWDPPDYTAKPLWECLFSDLLDPAWMKSSGQHHLLQFISRLAPYANRPFALRNWVRKTASALGIAPPRICRAGDRPNKKSQPYLLLELSTEGNYYNLRVRFMCDPGNYDDIYQEKLGFTLDDLPRHLGIVLKNPAITKACLSGNPPVLKFFLPVGLLNRDLDQWRPPGEKTPLSTKYGLVVRAGERLWGKCWIVNWGSIGTSTAVRSAKWRMISAPRG